MEEKDEAPGLEISFGQLSLVYFLRPPDLEALGIMKPLGP